MKKILVIILISISYSVYSQEDSLRVHINRIILENNKVESYIDVNDSIDLFIDAIQQRFGEVEEVDGVYNWSGIELDSLGKGVKITMIHGIWTTKDTQLKFKVCSPEKVGKLKSNEKRGIRIRVYMKEGKEAYKDALLKKSCELVVIQIVEELLNSVPEKTEE
ncbi:MAG: hypothetical protein HY951_09920 [Bacteroidia bacterium]|nr:hypothetical protein [Bacteroidia bacterium]